MAKLKATIASTSASSVSVDPESVTMDLRPPSAIKKERSFSQVDTRAKKGCIPLFFERASSQWWKPSFDSQILEKEFQRFSFTHIRRRLQRALIYISIADFAVVGLFCSYKQRKKQLADDFDWKCRFSPFHLGINTVYDEIRQTLCEVRCLFVLAHVDLVDGFGTSNFCVSRGLFTASPLCTLYLCDNVDLYDVAHPTVVYLYFFGCNFFCCARSIGLVQTTGQLQRRQCQTDHLSISATYLYSFHWNTDIFYGTSS